jgi:hypothetical protein
VILNQAERDVAVVDLLSKVSEVYALMTKIEEFGEIASMVAICGQIARQTLECADFIAHYSETKSVCESTSSHRRPKIGIISLYREKTWQAYL